MSIKPRDVIFWLHLIAGIIVGAIILIMATTGALLAYRGQIIESAERSYQIQIATQKRLSLENITGIINAQYNGRVSGFSVKADPQEPLIVNLGREKTLFVDPYTGNILGEGSLARHWLEKIEYWHRWLGLEGPLKSVGHEIKSVTNVIFLVMILTGLYLWWPRNWQWNTLKAIVQFNGKLKGRARDWNWHNVIGLWAAPFLLIIVLTGVIMSYQWANDLLYRLTGNPPPVSAQKDGPMGASKGEGKKEGGSRPDMDKILAVAQKQLPDWKAINIRTGRASSISVFIEENTNGYLPVRSQLTVSPEGEVLKWEPASEQNSGRKARIWARYLHTGEAGGPVGQTLALLAALSAILLVWTGFAMAWYRFFLTKGGK